MVLAVSSYARLRSTCDDENIINLSWTADERSYLAVDLEEIIRQEFDKEISSGLRATKTYAVQDPYGHDSLATALSHHFGVSSETFLVTCGAGVNSILHALAHLCSRHSAYIIGDVYPDFPHWVQSFGGICVTDPDARSLTEHGDAAVAASARVCFLERPNNIDFDARLQDLRLLCERVEASGCLVVVDESYGNYYPARFSAANLIGSISNIAVLRGLSKAYSLGSLRLGYCLSSPSFPNRIRSVVPPMLASSLSLAVGAAIIDLCDIFQPLRDRVNAVKQEITTLFSGSLVPLPATTKSLTPFLYFNPLCSVQLERARVIGKVQPFWSGARQQFHYKYRLSVPLLPERLTRFRSLLCPTTELRPEP